MVIALMNNLPELFGFVCAGGLGFFLGRKWERFRKS